MTISLSPSVQDVYQTMQRFAEDGEICCVSYNMLAQKSGYSKSTVINAVKELKWQQWIKKHAHNDNEMGNQTNKYKLLK